MTTFAVIRVNGREQGDCPFWNIAGAWDKSGGECELTEKPCNYGLTEVDTPKDCPLRKGPITIERCGARHDRWIKATHYEDAGES